MCPIYQDEIVCVSLMPATTTSSPRLRISQSWPANGGGPTSSRPCTSEPPPRTTVRASLQSAHRGAPPRPGTGRCPLCRCCSCPRATAGAEARPGGAGVQPGGRQGAARAAAVVPVGQPARRVLRRRLDRHRVRLRTAPRREPLHRRSGALRESCARARDPIGSAVRHTISGSPPTRSPS